MKDCISCREKEILQLLAEEYTSKEIANLLFTSHHTATTHRKNLLFKMGVRNTAGLIRMAYEQQILTIQAR